MKLYNVNTNRLPPGKYYFCADCKEWFGKKKRAPDAVCSARSCKAVWKKAQGIVVLNTSGKLVQFKPSKPARKPAPVSPLGCVALLVVTLLTLGCYSLYLAAMPNLRGTWARTFEGLWQGAVDVLIALGSQSLATLLLFVLVSAGVFLVLVLAASLSRRGAPGSGWQTAWVALTSQGRVAGTLINLIASLGALWIVPALGQRTPNLLDAGIQIVIALAIEYALFRLFD